MENKNSFRGVIRQAMITPKDFLVVKYVEHYDLEAEDVVNRTVTAKTEHRVGDSLKKQFNALRGVVAHLCGRMKKGVVDAAYINTRECQRDPELSHIEVLGLTLKKTDNGESVKIHCRWNCVGGGHFPFVTPAVEMFKGSAYEFSGNLEDIVSDCKIEIARYMDDVSGSGQLTLFIDEEGEMVSKDEF